MQRTDIFVVKANKHSLQVQRTVILVVKANWQNGIVQRTECSGALHLVSTLEHLATFLPVVEQRVKALGSVACPSEGQSKEVGAFSSC